ncbi:M3 family metallopeptidase [Chamaesiphon sp. VAR_48_metabat_135_sub]|uniref:M3 family metallopeptidase n=1 Tax=Chamaesiphon sp. VAR_48_metabat_135_sub TaxID=2964699 RepID=UPI00286C8008|nr:M3 family metallopeptidase [Chamaesiphon sp. VAR_48_metabat_135_sub]
MLPLLQGQGLPPFPDITPEQVVPAITELLAEANAALTELEANIIPTWAGLVEPLDRIIEKISWSWSIVGHLMGVQNSPELRAAHEEMQPQTVEFWMRLGQSTALYQGYKAIQASPEFANFEVAQKRIIVAAIRDMELSGVGLTGEPKQRFNEIQLALAEIANKFSNNVLDATKAYSLTLTTPEEITGLPASLLGQAAQSARAAGQEAATPTDGPWIITLDAPSFMPFMQHSQRRDLREQIYKAYVSRAASGEYDNLGNIDRILELRREMSNILGFANFAELSLASKMAPNVAAVESLLESLRSASFEAAKQDLENLRAFAISQGAPEANDLKHWDLAYWSERLREAKFDFNAEELRPYFPLEQVLSGLFNLAHKLFGITITAADGQAPVWNPDVRYFQVANEQQQPIAYFYLDAYSRPAEKRGGAWMADCVSRAKMTDEAGSKVRLPVAYLTCNQTPPVDDKPSLMTFGEVETLFHEFGHGLQHMLTTVDFVGASGISNVEWDAVELPSQFMENWCYDRPTLLSLGKHYETGEPLPEHYYQKIIAARTFMSGTGMLRQIHFSWLDLELHGRYIPGGAETVPDVRNRLAKISMVIPPLPEDNFLCSFGHIFAGGYAAGYYSYKWAEVLSADAFAAFEDAGLDDADAIGTTGRRFRDTVLSLGGSQHPMEVFTAFRGREPDPAALLRHNGLVAAK